MSVVGPLQESGLRVVAERSRGQGPPWRYEGEVTTPSARFVLTAVLSADGGLTVTIEPPPPAGLVDRVRLILRTAWKHARENETEPPRRVGRWRAEV